MSRREVSFTIDCPMPSDVVLRALTDFSEKRVTYFPNLGRGSYELLEQHGQTALVREGTGPFYNKERYDWSTRGRVWSIIEESNVVAPGGITDVRVNELRQGWCRVDVRLERDFIGWRGRLITASLLLNGRKRFFRRIYIRMLKNVQRSARKSRSKA